MVIFSCFLKIDFVKVKVSSNHLKFCTVCFYNISEKHKIFSSRKIKSRRKNKHRTVYRPILNMNWNLYELWFILIIGIILVLNQVLLFSDIWKNYNRFYINKNNSIITVIYFETIYKIIQVCKKFCRLTNFDFTNSTFHHKVAKHQGKKKN